MSQSQQGSGRPGQPRPGDMNPGDEVPPGPGAGEDVCPVCAGKGRVDGRECENCGGTGKIVEGIGGA